jgi:hypothetical protein
VKVKEVAGRPNAGGHVPVEGGELAPVEARPEPQLHVRQVADGRRLLTRWRAAYEATTSCPTDGIWGGG